MQTRDRTETRSSPTDRLPVAEAALRFAAERHQGQRLAGGAPFVQHPLEVAKLLSAAGCSDDVVASGVLHDVLETTDTPAIELEYRFGARVAALVRTVTEDDSIEDRKERKSALREQVARGPLEAAAVFAADKVSRTRHLRSQVGAGRSDDKARAKLDHYRASLSMLECRLGRDHRLVEQLRSELTGLEMGLRLPMWSRARALHAEIAEQLVVSEVTVKIRVGRLLTKLDLRDRVHAVVFALRIRPDASGSLRPQRSSRLGSQAIEQGTATRRTAGAVAPPIRLPGTAAASPLWHHQNVAFESRAAS